MRYHSGGSIIIMVTACVLFVTGVRLSYGQVTLDECLTSIEGKLKNGVSLDDVEAQMLKLTQNFQSPKELGTIYVHVAALYSEKDSMRAPAKVIACVTKALEYPLDPRDKVMMYLYWGTAIITQYQSAGQGEVLKHRPEIVMPFLNGLKLLIDDGIPENPVSLPAVGTFDISPDDSRYQEILAEHERQLKARERAEALEEMVRLRMILTRNIVDEYSVGMEATQELKEISGQIFRNDAAVGALLAKVIEKRAKPIKN